MNIQERPTDKTVSLTKSIQEDAARLLFISSLAACAMLFYRIYATGNFFYAFLVWNLFLGWIPYFLSLGFEKIGAFASHKLKACLLFGAWLAFLPNSPYILTDLIHLCPRPGIPMWFDMLLILIFAWTGLMLGLISIAHVQNYTEKNFSSRLSKAMLAFILVSCSFGVYVGRYLRWNSWDIVLRPFALMHNLALQFRHPFRHPQTFGMTFAFSVFLAISYYTLHIVSRKRKHEA
jgi:uncharacterized membrane protein